MAVNETVASPGLTESEALAQLPLKSIGVPQSSTAWPWAQYSRFLVAVGLPAVQESDDCPSSSTAISSDDLKKFPMIMIQAA